MGEHVEKSERKGGKKVTGRVAGEREGKRMRKEENRRRTGGEQEENRRRKGGEKEEKRRRQGVERDWERDGKGKGRERKRKGRRKECKGKGLRNVGKGERRRDDHIFLFIPRGQCSTFLARLLGCPGTSSWCSGVVHIHGGCSLQIARVESSRSIQAIFI